jgi:hypothetical protein
MAANLLVFICTTITQIFVVSAKTLTPRAYGRSAGFQTCCIADFPIGGAREGGRAAGWKPAIQPTWKSALRGCGVSRAGFICVYPLFKRFAPRFDLWHLIVIVKTIFTKLWKSQKLSLI